MKKVLKSVIASAVLLGGMCTLVGCSNAGGTITTTPNVGIQQGVAESVGKYSSVAYYELERPDDVRIPFEVNKIQKVSFKYRTLGSKEYTLKNDTLIVKKSVFENETAGDKRLRVFVDGVYTEITVRVVSKVIYTPADFNSIRENMNGVFVLGADIDFGGNTFFPIGKAVSSDDSASTFEGIFDGMGYTVSNLVIDAYDYAEGEDGTGQGPSLDGNKEGNGRNYSNGIFMSTGGSAQIINTSFINITVISQGLSGAVVGSNGGLIQNCFVTSTLESHGYSERAGAIVGQNGSGDAAGRIENCFAIYSWTGANPARGIADWNVGTIKNSYAALRDDYVFHMGYDSETAGIDDNFDYDEFITQDNFFDRGLGWYTMPAFPGSLSWVDGVLTYYKGGDIINSDVVRKEYLLNPDNFPEEDGWDYDVWNFSYGMFPTLKVQNK